MNKNALRVISDNVDSAIEGGVEQLALTRDNIEIVVNRRGISLFGFVIIPAIVSILYDSKDVGSALELNPDLIQLEISTEGVFLSHSGPLNPVLTPATINNYLERQNIYGADESKIDEFLRSDVEEKILIRGLDLIEAGESKIGLIITEDLMRAFAVKFEANEIAENDLRSALEKAGIVKGLNEEALQQICPKGGENVFHLIAEGAEAVEEVVQQPVFNVKFKQLKPKHCQSPEDPDLPVIRIASVRLNQLIAKRGKKTPGRPGYRIDASVIDYQKTAWERIHGGNHTFSVSREPEIYASVTGHAIYNDDGRLDVSRVLVIDGDVEAGPVEYKGKIIITGNAPAGSIVTATDDVIVLGVADGAIIRSGGDVIIYNGKKLKPAIDAVEEKPPSEKDTRKLAKLERINQEEVDEEDLELKAQIGEILDNDFDTIMEGIERQISNVTSNGSMLDRLRRNKEVYEELKSDNEKLQDVIRKIEALVPEIDRYNELKDSGEELDNVDDSLLNEQTTRMAQLMMLKEEKKNKLLNIGMDERLLPEEEREYKVAEEEVSAFLEAVEQYACEDVPGSMSAFQKIGQTVNTNSGLTIAETRMVQQQLVDVRGKIKYLGPRVEKLRAKKENGERLSKEERAVLDEKMAVLVKLMIKEEECKMKLLGKD